MIGNPPFDRDEDHILRALDVTGRHVAFLLRSEMLGGHDHLDDLWSCTPLRMTVYLVPRPQFGDSGGSDKAEYVLFWWDKAYHGAPTVAWLRWRERKATRSTRVPTGRTR